MLKRLKTDKNFKPCPAEDGEEVYANGIFKFNISKMIPYIQNNPDVFTPETVVVNEIYTTSPHINEDHLDSVDISKPVILAEISPDQYNLIDGNHRAEKAIRLGINELKAYRLTASQHIQFLTHKESYEKYIDYWNDKLKQQVGTFAKDTLYRMHIVLMGFEPYIWRMVQVKPEMPLVFFHRLIQNVMGWQDLHLHHFIKGDTFYGPETDENGGFGRMKQVDYKDLTIKNILTKQHERIVYEYDFGDGWQHEIRLEKIVPTGKKEHPVCLKGRMKCPPEDCGGVWGYTDLLEELSKQNGAERKLYLEDRFMDDFDPEHFDTDEINQQLKEWKAVWMNKWE